MFSQCVKIRGLPFEANALSIVEFFEYQVEEYCIHFIQDRPGGTKPHSGEAFIDCDDMEALLKFHKKHLGRRYVEVLPASKAEKAKFRPKLISMPTPPGIEINDDINDEPNFRGGAGMGRPIDHEKIEGGPVGGMGVGALEGTDVTRVLKARGVPFEAVASEVSEVFMQFGVDEQDVHIDLHKSGPRVGRPTGCAYIVFESEEMRAMAMKECEGALIGTRYLELFPASEREINNLAGGGGARGGGGAYDRQGGNTTSIRLWGLPYRATEEDIIDFCSPEFNVQPDMVTITVQDGRPNGEAYVDLGSEDLCREAKQALDRRDMGGRYIEVYTNWQPGQKGKGKGSGGKFAGGGPVRRGGGGGYVGGNSSRGGGGGGYFGWLKLRGLPFDAIESDVVQFMGFNFRVNENDVMIETNGNRATGHAFVRIQQADVPDAVRSLHKQHIGNRFIEVYESSYEEAMKGRGGGGGGRRAAPYGKGR